MVSPGAAAVMQACTSACAQLAAVHVGLEPLHAACTFPAKLAKLKKQTSRFWGFIFINLYTKYDGFKREKSIAGI